jgi:Putative phage metallopeptidase
VQRPNMTLAVKRLIRDVARQLPEFAHVRASRVLVVAGEARRGSRASIRPAQVRSRDARRRPGERKPEIRVGGRQILYVVTLRPLWFVGSTAEQRIATVLHELYHTSLRFDGTLHAGRRHALLPRPLFDARIRRLRDRYLARAPEALIPFGHEGLVRVRMWLERPSPWVDDEGDQVRRVYGEKQLFVGYMPMRSRRVRTRRPKATRQQPVTPSGDR